MRDTTADINEGIKSGAWTIVIVLGSPELGLTYEEVLNMDEN